MKSQQSLRRTFAIPLLLALLSVAGLVVALTGDGWRDVAAWFALGIPVLVTGRAMTARRR
ncbi:MAG: hypothetical protein LCH74_15245 [Proteobacteria bacterium]|nr:hypothetical protein [Pseudomonadota bacterium]